MTEYDTLKTTAQTLYGNYVKSGGFVESDSGSPSELALLFDLVHARIAGFPRQWPFMKVIATVTATGATTYNLKTLYPDFKSLYQVYGINSHIEHDHFSNAEANLTPADGWTIRNGVLTFTGTVPSSGSTFKIQYRSGYMVEDSSGNRKRFFENATDVTVLDAANENILILGIGQYINWKTDETSKEKRRETKEWFKEAWDNLFLDDEMDRPLKSMI